MTLLQDFVKHTVKAMLSYEETNPALKQVKELKEQMEGMKGQIEEMKTQLNYIPEGTEAQLNQTQKPIIQSGTELQQQARTLQPDPNNQCKQQ